MAYAAKYRNYKTRERRALPTTYPWVKEVVTSLVVPCARELAHWASVERNIKIFGGLWSRLAASGRQPKWIGNWRSGTGAQHGVVPMPARFDKIAFAEKHIVTVGLAC